MFPATHHLVLPLPSMVPQLQFAAQVKPGIHPALPSLQAGPLTDCFQRSQPPIRFGSNLAPQGFGGGDGPNDPRRPLLATSHYSEDEEETLPNPYHWNPAYGSFEPANHEVPELAGLDMSTPKPSKSKLKHLSYSGYRGVPAEELASKTLWKKGKAAKDAGDLVTAEYYYALAREKEPSKTGGPKKHQARRGTHESELSSRGLRKKGKAAKDAGDLVTAEYYYALAREKEPSITGGSKRYQARQGAPESDLAAGTLYKRAHEAKKTGDWPTANRLYALASQKESSSTGGPKKYQARHGAHESELADRTLRTRAKEAKEAGDQATAEQLYELSYQKRYGKSSQQPIEPIQPRKTRSIFSPVAEHRSHLYAHLENISKTTSSSLSQSLGHRNHSHLQRQDAVPPNAGHQPITNSTEPIGWQQALGDANLWRYHYGDGHYSDWNTKEFWDKQH